MQDNLDQKTTDGSKPLFWTAFAFYALIAFEFFYMASPFAAYFYSVYGPGMDWLQALPVADWTLWFFLPHLVEDTRSSLINIAEAFGVLLFFGGLAGFAIGAFQVYRSKLRGTGAVTGGIYHNIRHPQYAALIIASLGMLLVWPRFLVLFSTACVILAYVLLARAEERQCLRQFPDYGAYMVKTGMFFPGILPKSSASGTVPSIGRTTVVLSVFCISIVLATLVAFGIRSAAISSLYTVETDTGVFLSVAKIDQQDLSTLAEVALADADVKNAINTANADGRVLAYVLPTQMYVSEIPMDLPPGETFGHSVPRDADPARWKVVLTKAEFGAGSEGTDIIREAINKVALIEVHIDLSSRDIERRLAPPKDAFYNGRQVPIF